MYPDFLVRVVLISATGALSPGPLTVGAISLGSSKGWRSGLLISIGHIVVELPLVLLIALGIFYIPLKGVMIGLGLLGGAVLIALGILQLRDLLKKREFLWDKHDNPFTSPLTLGVALTSLNPLFIAWWLSIGGSLICEALGLMGFVGVVFLYASHFWLDVIWLSLLAHLSNIGYKRVRGFEYFMTGISVLMIILGLDMILRGIRSL
ncbi:MAG: lysine transporter LysE [Thermoprotei archaeon]|nr:MAG: lysine transporter LysE [Thermoprotei archaeon]